VAEVEFDSPEASERFDEPGWLGPDVTDDPAYANRTLAERGRP
jgi:CYTH domain-containing protein